MGTPDRIALLAGSACFTPSKYAIIRLMKQAAVIAYQADRIERLRKKIKTLRKTERYYKQTLHGLIGRLSRLEAKMKNGMLAVEKDHYLHRGGKRTLTSPSNRLPSPITIRTK